MSSLDREDVSNLSGSAVGVASFRERFHGSVLCSGDAGYEEARRVWNGNIDRRPFMIARCSGVADVIQAVALARTNGQLVSVRGGAHNAAGHATCDGGIVIDLSPMKAIRVDRSASRRCKPVRPGRHSIGRRRRLGWRRQGGPFRTPVSPA